MLTAPEVRDCLFSPLDSQDQAHTRNFIYNREREGERFSCADRCNPEPVLAPPWCTHILTLTQRPHYWPKNQLDSCFVQSLALCWHSMFLPHYNCYSCAMCFLKLSVFEYMRFFCSSYENNAICSLGGNSRKLQKSNQVFAAEQPQNISVGSWVGGR